ncbi:Isochorismatase hydrolase [Aspergillus karnatakaensis]|uniref:cysteine hydrolase family protein n=1 Tax=Aspergillus karnatakaensis TaxID=1810916 RepID=UPI003CCD097A
MSPKTALVLIDPLNDFLHPTGKLTSALPDLATRNTISNLETLVSAARENQIPIFYGLHQQWTPHAYHDWQHMTDSHVKLKESKAFEKGSFGGEIYEGLGPKEEGGDVVVSRHWNSDSFQNTDLDFQLRQRDITNLVFAGLTANTCLESSARHAYELGYKVTILKDATAGFSKELTDVAIDLVWPLFARVLSVAECIEGNFAKVDG